jgi:metal-responsive CopG/Arc/MetJ family transcriptional regulator
MASDGYRKLVATCFKVDVETLEELDRVAKARNMERSELIRRAVRWYLWYIKSSQKPAETKRMKIYTVP